MRKLSIFIIILTVCAAAAWYVKDANAAISAAGRTALLELYNSTNGDNWNNNSGWKTPPLDESGFAMPGTECNWYGVMCNTGENYVEELYMRNNNLAGTLPESLENLSLLKALYLDNNLLIGNIPETMGNLLTLQYLYLNSNQLTGNIPATLGNLIQLQILKLNQNQLIGPVPQTITMLLELIDNESDFRENSLCTSDATVRDFLNAKQTGGNWESTQTVNIRSVISVLQIIAGMEPDNMNFCDINGDGKIGMEEAIYILQRASESR